MNTPTTPQEATDLIFQMRDIEDQIEKYLTTLKRYVRLDSGEDIDVLECDCTNDDPDIEVFHHTEWDNFQNEIAIVRCVQCGGMIP